MRKFLKRHQKKFIALVMIILMISFAASSGNRTNNNRNDAAIGHIGKTTVYGTELQQAHEEWGVLTRYVTKETTNPYTRQPVEYPIVLDLFPQDILQNDKATELFMLLRHEAHEAGVRANADEVESVFTNNYHRPPGADESMDYAARDAITDFLLIGANFQRLANDVKVSVPQRDYFLAQAAQEIQLKVVEFTQSDYITKTPPPTTQQAQEQFSKYADVVPGHPDEKNPFGYGYRLPDGVKLQYLVINRDDARTVVEATQSPYDWDVKARLYYRQHPDEFAATQPTTTAIGPTSQPSEKPYAQVSADALSKIRDPLVEKLMFDVQGKIVATMQGDWRTYNQSGGIYTKSSLGAPYPSYSYLNNLAKMIQSQPQLGMKVYATDLARDFLSEQELTLQAGIGRTTNGRAEFPQYAMQLANVYLSKTDKGTPAALAQLMQPAAPVRDLAGNIYVFRLTDARSAQPAPSLSAISLKVDLDLQTAAAYKMAQDAATPLLTAAQKGALTQSATALGKTIWTTASFRNPLGRGPAYLGTDVSLSDDGQNDFVKKAFELLAKYNPTQNPHPVRLIGVPEDGKVYVAQLTNVTAPWTRDNYYLYVMQTAGQLHQLDVVKLQKGWLDYDAVVARLGYKPEASQKDSSG